MTRDQLDDDAWATVRAMRRLPVRFDASCDRGRGDDRSPGGSGSKAWSSAGRCCTSRALFSEALRDW
jgi:hypothetical protein